ncbi:hypothetical protein Z043_117893 [Scleropages formosus]|uniref:Zinc finger CCHC domain-containing protein 4-like n=1 Tax=Scleropages formosus TaxID=113540 RepID=A0A0P7UPN1_SCLFO|nr:hypothetical protein Z043_117893 [Scleropages formosus]
MVESLSPYCPLGAAPVCSGLRTSRTFSQCLLSAPWVPRYSWQVRMVGKDRFYTSTEYAQFYAQDEFCHYNMFNHHFFGGEAAKGLFEAFLHEEDGAKVVMVTDPPFGGLVKPLAHSFTQISETWRALRTSENTSHEMPMFWIFPYFFESRILECFSTFSMLDYQSDLLICSLKVDYDNHPLYKHGKTGRKQSPVRLFTNLCPCDIVLPEEEGYRWCSVCERYVSSGNKHCSACNACTSKDGRQWRHCSLCNKCVKPSNVAPLSHLRPLCPPRASVCKSRGPRAVLPVRQSWTQAQSLSSQCPAESLLPEEPPSREKPLHAPRLQDGSSFQSKETRGHVNRMSVHVRVEAHHLHIPSLT